MDKDYLLVEEIEDQFIEELVEYKKYLEENWTNNDFIYDPYYSEKLISNTVYTQFVNNVNERMRNREFKKVYEYFSLSIEQFKTHIPRNRYNNFILKFHFEYDPELKLEKTDLDLSAIFALNAFTFYTKHFNKFKKHVESAFEDFKNGFFGKINTVIDEKEILDFLDVFQQSICYNTSLFEFRNFINEKALLLQREIIGNLVSIDKNDKKAYLNRIKYDLEQKQTNFQNIENIVLPYLNEFQLEKFEDLLNLEYNHPLIEILNEPVPSRFDLPISYINSKIYQIQSAFFSYFSQFQLQQTLEYIKEYSKESNLLDNLNNKKFTNPKLKTTLTVPQLAYIFKLLMDIRPAVFDAKTNKEIYQFIEANFTTKGKEDAGPTVAKLNNLYSSVDKDTANFWVEKLQKMLQDARKV